MIKKENAIMFDDLDEFLNWFNAEDEHDNIYSKRIMLTLTDFDRAVDKAALVYIAGHSSISDETLEAMAMMGRFIGFALFGEAYLDTKTKKEEK